MDLDVGSGSPGTAGMFLGFESEFDSWSPTVADADLDSGPPMDPDMYPYKTWTVA